MAEKFLRAKSYVGLAAALALALVLALTQSAGAQPTGTQHADKPLDPELIAADNAFGLTLLSALNQKNGGANVAISPTSIALVMQIVFNGAKDETRKAMANVLQLGWLQTHSLNVNNEKLRLSLANPDADVKLTIADSLWIDPKQHSLVPAFIEINKTYYAAHIGDLAGAPKNVNAWVSDATAGLIQNILDAVGPDDVAVIANAIYFKGAWSVPFDPAVTHAGEFTMSDLTKVSCQMMHRHGTLDYFAGADFQVLRLPYGRSKRFSMLILLPKADVPLNTFMTRVSAESLRSWLSQLKPASLQVELPRFKVDYGSSLIESLSALGMGIAFDPQRAQFPGIASGVYLSKVEHKAVIQVDEAGTTAAAATIAIPTVTSFSRPITMAMDHPFFYAIADRETGALLFMGTLAKPSDN
jgi:serine protease inhibitor